MIAQVVNLKNKLFVKIDHIPDSLNKSYYPSLDGLRGVAILFVIFYHGSFNTRWNVWIDGAIGVQVFFVLSGFLITTLLIKEHITKGKVSLKKFYIRRSLRILPVAYLYIFTTFILSNFFHFKLALKSILTSVFFLKNLPIASEWSNGHFWTLSVEEQFYLLFPILLITSINKYIKLILLLFILVPLVDYIGFHNIGVFYSVRWVHVITFLFLALLDQGTMYILLGSLTSILIFKNILVVERFKNYYFLSTVCFILAILIRLAYSFWVIPYYITSSLCAILIAFVIVLNLNENNFFTNILKNPVLLQIGLLSYSLYVWQQIFMAEQPWKGLFKYADSFLLNIVMLFIVASCSYYLYERRFLKLKKQFK